MNLTLVWAQRCSLPIAALLVSGIARASGDCAPFPGRGYHVAGDPTRVELVDISGDGCVDAVYGTTTGHTGYFRNDGHGRFPDHLALMPGVVRCFGCGDVDGDQAIDQVAFDSTTRRLQLLRNLGNGLFGAPELVFQAPATEFWSVLHLADLDNDGHLDIVSVYHDSSPLTDQVHILLGDGLGHFSLSVSLPVTGNSITSGDFDGDGLVDLALVTVTAGSSIGRLFVLMNQGGGVFSAPLSWDFGFSADHVTSADLDGDGRAEIVWSDFNSGAVRIRYGSGAFGFFDAGYFSGPAGVVAADLDGDGDRDLAVGGSALNGGLSVLTNDGTGGFSAPAIIHNGFHREIAAADIDSDGDVDLLCGENYGNLTTQENLGAGTISGVPITPTSSVLHQTVPVDVDGDGDQDLALFSNVDLTIEINSGTASFTPAQNFPLAYRTKGCFADFDGDGDADMATVGPNSVQVYGNSGAGQFTLQTTLPGFALPSGVVGLIFGTDMDQDGDPDIVVARAQQPSIAVFRNQGAWSFTGPTFGPTGFGLQGQVAVTDVNGDGAPDVVHLSAGNAVVLANDGAGGLPSASPIPVTGPSLSGLQAVDLDGDGDTDLVAAITSQAAGTSPRIFVLRNDGAGAFTLAFSFHADPVGYLAASDVDSDGDVDLLSSVSPYGGPIVFDNRGNGTFGAPVPYIVSISGPADLVLRDFDGDGRVDVISQGGFGTLAFLHNSGRCGSGTVFCTGDGSGTACPCGNASGAGQGRGCLNSFGLGGELRAHGLASVSNDSLVLVAENINHGASALFFQGDGPVNGGQGNVFGDGLRCAGGSVHRLGTKTSIDGWVRFPDSTDLPVSVVGSVPGGAVRYYQTWYRNAASFCTSAAFNLTNGMRIDWLP